MKILDNRYSDYVKLNPAGKQDFDTESVITLELTWTNYLLGILLFHKLTFSKNIF